MHLDGRFASWVEVMAAVTYCKLKIVNSGVGPLEVWARGQFSLLNIGETVAQAHRNSLLVEATFY